MTEDISVRAEELAEVLSVTDREIRNLAAEGIVRKVRDKSGHEVRGRYSLKESVRRYVLFMRAKKSATQEKESTLDDLRAQKLQIQVERQRMALDIDQGNLVPARLFAELYGKRLLAAREVALSLPTKLTQTLAGLTDEPKIFKLLTDEMEAFLNNLAEPQTEQIMARASDYITEPEPEPEDEFADEGDADEPEGEPEPPAA